MISLLNVDLKIISKALSDKLKEVPPHLISSQQMAYVENRHIGESEWSDVIIDNIWCNRNHQNKKYWRFFSYNGHWSFWYI